MDVGDRHRLHQGDPGRRRGVRLDRRGVLRRRRLRLVGAGVVALVGEGRDATRVRGRVAGRRVGTGDREVDALTGHGHAVAIRQGRGQRVLRADHQWTGSRRRQDEVRARERVLDLGRECVRERPVDVAVGVLPRDGRRIRERPLRLGRRHVIGGVGRGRSGRGDRCGHVADGARRATRQRVGDDQPTGRRRSAVRERDVVRDRRPRVDGRGTGLVDRKDRESFGRGHGLLRRQ